MKVERTIDARPTEEELASFVSGAAVAFDLRAERAGDGFTLIGGTLFAADPNGISMRINVRAGEAGIGLNGSGRAFPGTRGKVRRILEAQVTAVGDYIEARVRGRPAEALKPALLFRTVGSGLAGLVRAAAWMATSTAVSMAAVLLATTGLGCVLMDRQIAELDRRAGFLETVMHQDPLPRVAELKSEGLKTLLGSAALFAAPCAFFVGLVVVVAMGWTEAASRLAPSLLWLIRDALMAALMGWGLFRFYGDSAVAPVGGILLCLAIVLSAAGVWRLWKVGAGLLQGIRWLAGIVAIGGLALIILNLNFKLGLKLPGAMDYLLFALAVYLATFAGAWVGLFAFLFLVLFIGIALVPFAGVLTGVAFAVTIPLAGVAGYLWVWGRRREMREARTAAERDADLRRSALMMIGCVFVLGGIAWTAMPRPMSSQKVPFEMSLFRDRVLMKSTPGRSLASAYYRYTLYAAEPAKAVFEIGRLDNPAYRRSQVSILMTSPDTGTLSQLERMGFYVTHKVRDNKSDQQIRNSLDFPYDLFILDHGIKSRNEGNPDEGEMIDVPLLKELRARGLLDRVIIFAPDRDLLLGNVAVVMSRLPEKRHAAAHALYRSIEDRAKEFMSIQARLKEGIAPAERARLQQRAGALGKDTIGPLTALKALLDPVHWDVPPGFPPDQVRRIRGPASERLDVVLARVAGRGFHGNYLRLWTSLGFLLIFYVGGALIVLAVLLPPALLFAELFRRAPRRVAVAGTGLVFLGSVVGLMIWAAPHLEVQKRIAEVRALDPAKAGALENLIEAMGDPNRAEVRYEALLASYIMIDEAVTRGRKLQAQLEGLPKDSATKVPDPVKQEQLKAGIRNADQRLQRYARELGPSMRSRLDDPDLLVRVWACTALGRLAIVKQPGELDGLIRALDDEKFYVQYRAAEALGQIGSSEWPSNPRGAVKDRIDADVVPRLQKLLREEPWYVGNYALQALRNIDPRGRY